MEEEEEEEEEGRRRRRRERGGGGGGRRRRRPSVVDEGEGIGVLDRGENLVLWWSVGRRCSSNGVVRRVGE